MDEMLGQPSGASRPAPKIKVARNRESGIPKRLRRQIFFLLVLAVASSITGYEVARFEAVWSKWLSSISVHAATSSPSPALVSAAQPKAIATEIEEISHLAPQQQAERLLDLAIQHHESSLDLIRQNLDSWRGRVKDTDHLFHLVLVALESEDPRVRVAALEVDLAANNLRKSPQSVAQLLNEIHNDPASRDLALWRLGALGNRGVEPAIVLGTLLRYAHDRNQQTRFWAVEGLAMLGSEGSIDPLLSILAHDPSPKVRERAACSLARSGMLSEEQRMSAIPHLLNLLDDDALDPATQDLVYAALQAITGAGLGRDPQAWREWWAHHDQPEKGSRVSAGLLLA
jgi:HEAT repeat protein